MQQTTGAPHPLVATLAERLDETKMAWAQEKNVVMDALQPIKGAVEKKLKLSSPSPNPRLRSAPLSPSFESLQGALDDVAASRRWILGPQNAHELRARVLAKAVGGESRGVPSWAAEEGEKDIEMSSAHNLGADIIIEPQVRGNRRSLWDAQLRVVARRVVSVALPFGRSRQGSGAISSSPSSEETRAAETEGMEERITSNSRSSSSGSSNTAFAVVSFQATEAAAATSADRQSAAATAATAAEGSAAFSSPWPPSSDNAASSPPPHFCCPSVLTVTAMAGHHGGKSLSAEWLLGDRNEAHSLTLMAAAPAARAASLGLATSHRLSRCHWLYLRWSYDGTSKKSRFLMQSVHKSPSRDVSFSPVISLIQSRPLQGGITIKKSNNDSSSKTFLFKAFGNIAGAYSIQFRLQQGLSLADDDREDP